MSEPFALPEGVSAILTRLRDSGFPAFPAGGCVRDSLLGRRVHDWDVATAALPEQVTALFRRTAATGLKHGTVTVLLGRLAVEVTTFRTEGGYTDGRRPDSVTFVPRLEADLARRDFTVNAMALGPDGQVIDPFGGRDDLRRRIIRCVGDPAARFGEDALRLWRAVRFSAMLGFGIEAATWDAMSACAPLTARLAPERVSAELERILLSGAAARLADVLPLGLLDPLLTAHPTFRLPLETLKTLPRKPETRWAGLAALLRRAGCLADSLAFLRALRLPNRVTYPAGMGAEWALAQPLPGEPVGWRRLCADRGVPEALCAAAAGDALAGGPPRYVPALREVLRPGPCLSVKQLALTGEHLALVGLAGPQIGRAQRRLLEHVLRRPEDNTLDALLSLLETIDSKNR
ncbi:MAG: tRNA nucleotidyltransferase [Oscillospiraceae bacterium]|jgi:tRNA nucleotidyltransferase (CCA-adding enzyme)|nr:tRNA nucleotidyltransferase [Oscillospiraceae bacterium]